MAVGDHENGPTRLGVGGGGLGRLALVEVALDAHCEILQVVGLDGQQSGGFIRLELETRIADELSPAPVEQAGSKLIADDGFTEKLVETHY